MSNGSKMESFSPLAARILLSLVYLVNGVGMIGAFSDISALMTAKGMPASDIFLIAAIALWLAGGLCLVFGWRTRLAALLLLLATIPATFVFHSPWTVEPAQFHNELNHFLKNLAILGGLLYVVSFGSGSRSLDHRKAAASAERPNFLPNA